MKSRLGFSAGQSKAAAVRFGVACLLLSFIPSTTTTFFANSDQKESTDRRGPASSANSEEREKEKAN